MRRAEESHELFVRRSEAQSTVEVALSLPVVILVFAMLLQGALYMHALNVVRSAAQEGARTAAAEGHVGDGPDVGHVGREVDHTGRER